MTLNLRHTAIESNWDAARDQIAENFRDVADAIDDLAAAVAKLQAKPLVEVLGYAASVQIDASKGPMFVLELLGNVTLEDPVNDTPGSALYVVVRQDATGARTVGFGSRWVASSANAVNAGASTTSLLYARSYDNSGTITWVYSFLT